MYHIDVKPLSSNASNLHYYCKKAGKIKRVKTPEYKEFEFRVRHALSKLELPMINKGEKIRINFEFGVATNASDWDNPIKPFQDVLSKYLDFNDNIIKGGTVEKEVVGKGNEYIKFEITKIGEEDGKKK